ncbi:MAG TPA: hypothetical protein VI279_07490 [Rhodocyclaceae bacterium]
MLNLRRLLPILALLPLAATAGIPASGLPLDDHHLLTATPEGGWQVLDSNTGNTRPLIVPALHPDANVSVAGPRLAYVSQTHRGERSQLGCVSYDWNRGKVIEREETALLAAQDGTPPGSAEFAEDGQKVSCHIRGEHCDKAGENCEAREQLVALGAAKPAAKASARHAKKGKTRGKAVKHGKGGKAPAKKPHGKPAAKAKSVHAKPRSAQS